MNRYIFISIILTLNNFAYCQANKNVSQSIIIVNEKSEPITFASLSILNIGFSVKDTVADVNGYFVIPSFSDKDSIIVSSAGYYPQILSFTMIQNSNVVILQKQHSKNLVFEKANESIYVDTLLNSINTNIELIKSNWDKRYKQH